MRTELKWNGEKAKLEMKAGAIRGLHTAAEHLLGVSQTRVPLEEGTLERSARVDVDDSAMKAAVSYDTVYARRQHEELTWKHDPGRTAKYLEGPLSEESNTIQDLIGASIRRALR